MVFYNVILTVIQLCALVGLNCSKLSAPQLETQWILKISCS